MALRRVWNIVCDVCNKETIPLRGDILRYPDDQRALMFDKGWMELEENHGKRTICSHRCLRKYALHPEQFPYDKDQEVVG